MQFLNLPDQTYSNPSNDGRNLVGLNPLYFITDDGRRFRIRVGATTDGASGPSPVWAIVPPEGGPWFIPARIHDAGYRAYLEQSFDGGLTWRRVFLPKEQNDALLNEGMISMGVDEFRRVAIYEAVKLAGANAFVQDLAQPIPE